MHTTNRFIHGLVLATLAVSAQAHQIWLEQPAKGGAIIRFGEYAENLREASPGVLDTFVRPTATLESSQGDRQAEGVKAATGFRLPFTATRKESIVAEEARYPLRRFEREGRPVASWYWPGARWVAEFSARQPRLVLDITPTGKAGELRVSFKGQPLPGAKVALVTQSGWSREAVADQQGTVRFSFPWKGQYVAETSHLDRTPGERTGGSAAEKYDGINYVTTLTYVKGSGVAPIPAGPVTPPSQ